MSEVNRSFPQNQIKVIKSQRKTVSLSVSDGVIVVKAPTFVGDDELLSFVERHRLWIEDRLKRSGEKLDLSDGARLRLFGKEYIIRTGRSGFVGDSILLPESGREEALKRILKRTVSEKMGVLTERIADRCGFSYAGVKISSARTRWGSCNRKGEISYSFRVAFLDAALCEYIAVHELCHTVRFNHSKQFWELVGQVLPDFKICRKRLKESCAMPFL